MTVKGLIYAGNGNFIHTVGQNQVATIDFANMAINDWIELTVPMRISIPTPSGAGGLTFTMPLLYLKTNTGNYVSMIFLQTGPSDVSGLPGAVRAKYVIYEFSSSTYRINSTIAWEPLTGISSGNSYSSRDLIYIHISVNRSGSTTYPTKITIYDDPALTEVIRTYNYTISSSYVPNQIFYYYAMATYTYGYSWDFRAYQTRFLHYNGSERKPTYSNEIIDETGYIAAQMIEYIPVNPIAPLNNVRHSHLIDTPRIYPYSGSSTSQAYTNVGGASETATKLSYYIKTGMLTVGNKLKTSFTIPIKTVSNIGISTMERLKDSFNVILGHSTDVSDIITKMVDDKFSKMISTSFVEASDVIMDGIKDLFVARKADFASWLNTNLNDLWVALGGNTAFQDFIDTIVTNLFNDIKNEVSGLANLYELFVTRTPAIVNQFLTDVGELIMQLIESKLASDLWVKRIVSIIVTFIQTIKVEYY